VQKMWLPSVACLRDQRLTLSLITSLLLGIGLGLFLRFALGGADEWKSENLVWVSLPGNLFMRTITCLSMPLVLPKLITSLGSMDMGEGGKIFGRVLLFYGAFNVLIETSAVLIFYAVIPADNEEILSTSNKIQTDSVASNLPFPFAMRDLAFNIVPDNVLAASFRRFRTQAVREEGRTTFSDDFSLDPNILGLVIVSSALGVAIAKLGDEAKPVLSFFSSLTKITSSLMDSAITYMSPPGLLSLVATQVVTVVDPSTALIRLGRFVLTVVLGELVLVLLLSITYLVVTRKKPLRFFAGMTEALLVNFGTASSIAGFPVTLKCLTNKNGFDPNIASLILSIAILINLASYPIIGFLYVARLEGSHIGVDHIVMAVLVAAILAYGTGGVPQNSFLTILLLCPMFGVPTTKLSNILAVDLLVDRIHTCCKTLTDATAVAVVAHLLSSTAPDRILKTQARAPASKVNSLQPSMEPPENIELSRRV